MPRQAQRFDDHDVESDGQSGQLGAHRQKRLDGASDASPLAW
jgi:hypothetical protein